MTITPPIATTPIAQRTMNNNFLALQSAKLAVTQTSANVSFTNLPGGAPVTFRINNAGSNLAYLCGSNSSGAVAAVVSSSAPLPASGTGAVSNCDAIASGESITRDFVKGTDTIAAICSGTNTTSLEISIGFGSSQ